MKDTGGPAFPFVFDDMATRSRQVYTGMSIRDWFAGMAMQGMIACDTERSPEQVPIIVKSAYFMADAMLKERSKE
jgi:hypothetical protein